MLSVEGEDARVDNRMLRDERVQQKQKEVSLLLLLLAFDLGRLTRSLEFV